LDDAKKDNADRISNLRNDILSAQADLAQHEAVLKEFARLAPTVTGSTNAGAAVPPEAIKDYRNISGRLDLLSRNEQELLTQFTETSAPVKQVRRQIADAEQAKQQLEQKYPALGSVAIPALATVGQAGGRPIDPAAETIQVGALKAKLDFLNSQLVQARVDEAKVEDMETTIVELQRKKDLLEAQYRYFSSSLEQARFDEALGAGKLSNISVAQAPSPPYRDLNALNKLLAMVAAGGLLGGIALAFLIELYLDQTLKRPVEVETRLRLPLFLSIPDTARNGFEIPGTGSNGHLRLKAPGSQTAAGETGDAAKAEKMEVALWDPGHNLHPFFEALRDRLVTYFDVNNLTRNPKLVAVMSCAKGAGVTTIAAGLAATLSETGEGNVLLVDMTRGQGAAHPFYKGKPACSLTDLLEDQKDQKKDSAQVQENLYLVSEGINGSKVPSILPRQFAYLVPKLRASDYDYIIFDMPPVSQISVTSKLGRLMDVNLMVVESEKTDRELVKQASAMVAGEKANVGLVLNKKRTYVPQWLHQEL
jgi:Mrp family chromosome partitioning ATPase